MKKFLSLGLLSLASFVSLKSYAAKTAEPTTTFQSFGKLIAEAASPNNCGLGKNAVIADVRGAFYDGYFQSNPTKYKISGLFGIIGCNVVVSSIRPNPKKPDVLLRYVYTFSGFQLEDDPDLIDPSQLYTFKENSVYKKGIKIIATIQGKEVKQPSVESALASAVNVKVIDVRTSRSIYLKYSNYGPLAFPTINRPSKVKFTIDPESGASLLGVYGTSVTHRPVPGLPDIRSTSLVVNVGIVQIGEAAKAEASIRESKQQTIQADDGNTEVEDDGN